MVRRVAAILAAVLLLTTPLASAGEPPILTLSGAIAESNRGPSSEDDFTMLGAHDIAFDSAFAVTRADIAALPQVTVTAPLGQDGADAIFTGPLLRDVLALAGSAGDSIMVTALDGYGVPMEIAFMEAHAPILAIEADGASLAIGDYGPAMVIFAPTTDPDLQELFNGLQVWAVFHIGVE
ncbi:MAG: hypothetical protein AAF409_03965 [Pseudomonadota bacterium]